MDPIQTIVNSDSLDNTKALLEDICRNSYHYTSLEYELNCTLLYALFSEKTPVVDLVLEYTNLYGLDIQMIIEHYQMVRPAMIKYLVDQMNNKSILDELLVWGSKQGDQQLVKWLLEKNFCDNPYPAIEAATKNGYHQIILLFMEYVFPTDQYILNQLLVSAIIGKNIDSIKLFIKLGADINFIKNNGETPISGCEDIEVVTTLLELGADPTAGNFIAVKRAVWQNRLDLLRLFFKKIDK